MKKNAFFMMLFAVVLILGACKSPSEKLPYDGTENISSGNTLDLNTTNNTHKQPEPSDTIADNTDNTNIEPENTDSEFYERKFKTCDELITYFSNMYIKEEIPYPVTMESAAESEKVNNLRLTELVNKKDGVTYLITVNKIDETAPHAFDISFLKKKGLGPYGIGTEINPDIPREEGMRRIKYEFSKLTEMSDLSSRKDITGVSVVFDIPILWLNYDNTKTCSTYVYLDENNQKYYVYLRINDLIKVSKDYVLDDTIQIGTIIIDQETVQNYPKGEKGVTENGYEYIIYRSGGYCFLKISDEYIVEFEYSEHDVSDELINKILNSFYAEKIG